MVEAGSRRSGEQQFADLRHRVLILGIRRLHAACSRSVGYLTTPPDEGSEIALLLVRCCFSAPGSGTAHLSRLLHLRRRQGHAQRDGLPRDRGLASPR